MEFFVGVPKIVQNFFVGSLWLAFAVANSLILSVKSTISLFEKLKFVEGLGSIRVKLCNQSR